MIPFDFVSRQIHIGDTVAFAWREGSKMMLRKMEVDGFEGNFVVGPEPDHPGKRRRRAHRSVCVVITEPVVNNVPGYPSSDAAVREKGFANVLGNLVLGATDGT